MGTIKAIILDLDGVITDTAEYHFLGWKRLAEEEGIPFTRQDNEQLRGVSRRQSLLLILGERQEEYTEEQIQEMMARKNGYYQEMLDNLTAEDFLPGAKELIAEIKARSLKIAVGSASRNTKRVLNSLKITDLFDAIGDGYSVERAKPAPDLFVHTAGKMGFPPRECVVIEDAESGVEAALTGGFVAVGVGPEERVGKAHFRYDDTASIDLDEVLA
jgi:beta-phosphoglucomutase